MNIQVELLKTGCFYADGGAMFGAIPKRSWSRRYFSDENNRCVLNMYSLLIRAGERIILIDLGADSKYQKALAYYVFFDMQEWKDLLKTRSLSVTDITDVVFTHLHFDHCGSATFIENGKVGISFPKARHWVSASQWKNYQEPHPLEKDSFFDKNLNVVAEARLLQLIEKDCILCPGVRLCLMDGHSEGQIVVYVETELGTVVFAGDVLPLAANLSLEWISAYDQCPQKSWYAKKRLLDEAVRMGQTVIYCHDAYLRSSTVKKAGSFYVKDSLVDL